MEVRRLGRIPASSFEEISKAIGAALGGGESAEKTQKIWDQARIKAIGTVGRFTENKNNLAKLKAVFQAGVGDDWRDFLKTYEEACNITINWDSPVELAPPGALCLTSTWARLGLAFITSLSSQPFPHKQMFILCLSITCMVKAVPRCALPTCGKSGGVGDVVNFSALGGSIQAAVRRGRRDVMHRYVARVANLHRPAGLTCF